MIWEAYPWRTAEYQYEILTPTVGPYAGPASPVFLLVIDNHWSGWNVSKVVQALMVLIGLQVPRTKSIQIPLEHHVYINIKLYRCVLFSRRHPRFSDLLGKEQLRTGIQVLQSQFLPLGTANSYPVNL